MGLKVVLNYVFIDNCINLNDFFFEECFEEVLRDDKK